MTVKDGHNLYAKTPATIVDPPEHDGEPLEPKPAGTVADGLEMYAKTRGTAAYRTN